MKKTTDKMGRKKTRERGRGRNEAATGKEQRKDAGTAKKTINEKGEQVCESH